ncbi:putative membrane protein (TIGR02234 family) [Streptosporangium becharense]|uniref:Putative membrane protein (TIGR02234 family) n=1 Tax=Streptosporangium becharense TaxID=1816182 RepID=A0A7W9ICL5_9ACTN|nr:Trp biosynthesis-associated membrane protein [Streptosporangium becharense]MBB2912910.1 putative membrane protein (TIGR02234 family) [Streptosporangium becharense]MBB5818265.1 putative membrane protein (TIGR02234 family) [Streptosporangium becharense]
MRAGREPWIWAAVCAAGAALVLLASGREWFAVTYGARRVPVSAADLAPALGPAAWASLAAVVAVLATRGVWRRGVGVVMALCGAGVVAGSWWGSGADAALRISAEQVPAAAGTVPQVVPALVWPVLASAGGLLLVAGGVLAALRGARWPGMSGRYDRPGTAAGGETAAPGALNERALWDALDRGTDPTAGPDDEDR